MAQRTDAKEKNATTLGDQIYHRLKSAIIKHEIKPKDRISEDKIAAQFNVSRTPVREAIMRLYAEGFIESTPYRSMIVKEVSLERYFQVCESMVALDTQACKQAIIQMSDDNLEKLKDLMCEMETLCRVETLDEYMEVNFQIHIHVWNMLKNKFFIGLLLTALNTMRLCHLSMLHSQFNLSSAYMEKSLKIHQKLLEKFVNKDTKGLSSLIKKHWLISRDSYSR
ncbi:GntR family transcriptional regulator [Acidobacteriota bacterium]